MARARTRSIAPVPRPRDSLLNRQLRRWLVRELKRLHPDIERSAAACNADYYRKHFNAVAHATLLLFHGLVGTASLRQSYSAFSGCRALVQFSGLATADRDRLAVSFSQVADSNTTRPAAFLAGLLPPLVARVRSQSQRGTRDLPPNLTLLDSTFLRLSLKLARWLPNRSNRRAGLTLQVHYRPARDLPEGLLLTTTTRNDVQGLDALLLDDPDALLRLADAILVFDLGYYSHARLAVLDAAGVSVVTRRHHQATLTVLVERAVQQPLWPLPGETADPTVCPRITVEHDQEVSVGSPNNRRGAVLPCWRLVTATVAPTPDGVRHGAAPVVYEILTNRWDLTAAEVVQCYLWRWEIELFFRWLKAHLRIKRWLGYSRNAAELTIWLGMIVHLLTVLAAQALGQVKRSPALLERLRTVVRGLMPADLRAVPAPAQQLAFAVGDPAASG